MIRFYLLPSLAKTQYLNGFCHKDIIVLCQLCADVITEGLYPYTKCFCKIMKKSSKKFHQGTLTMMICYMICEKKMENYFWNSIDTKTLYSFLKNRK